MIDEGGGKREREREKERQIKNAGSETN